MPGIWESLVQPLYFTKRNPICIFQKKYNRLFYDFSLHPSKKPESHGKNTKDSGFLLREEQRKQSFLIFPNLFIFSL